MNPVYRPSAGFLSASGYSSDQTYNDKALIAGDINGDSIVNIQDATQIGLWWQKTVPPAPANVDISGNDIVNIYDVAAMGINWQKHA